MKLHVSPTSRPKKTAGPDATKLQQFGAYYGGQPVWGWTVDMLADALLSHASGTFGLSARLWEDMAAHPWIFNALQERAKVFTVCPHNVTSAGSTETARRRSKRCADFVREIFHDVLPLATRRDLQRHEIGMGQAIYGINWESVRDGADTWWIPKVVPWDPGLVGYWQGVANPDTADGGTWMATTQSHGLLKVEPGKGRWGFIARRTLQPWLGGAVRVLGDSHVGDGYNFRDNQRHQELWGKGIVKFRFPRSWNQHEINAATESLLTGSGGGVLQCPADEQGRPLVDADLMRADGAGWQTFDATEKRILRRMLIALLRQDMLTAGTTGLAANDPRMTAAWACVEDDAATYGDAQCTSVVVEEGDERFTVPAWQPVEGPLRRDLWRWVAYFNFGDADLAPYTWWDATPYTSFEERLNNRAKRGRERALAYQAIAVSADKLPGSDLAYIMGRCGLLLRPPEV